MAEAFASAVVFLLVLYDAQSGHAVGVKLFFLHVVQDSLGQFGSDLHDIAQNFDRLQIGQFASLVGMGVHVGDRDGESVLHGVYLFLCFIGVP